MAEARSNLRAVRVPDDLWKAAQAKAAAEGTSVSAVLNEALRAYTALEPVAAD